MAAATNTQFAVAVHVLTYLASAANDRPVNSDELAASASTNPVYVRRLLGPLRDASVVRARPGSGGGWELARPAADIRLGDVWRVLHGDEPVLGLHHPNPACPVGAGVERVLERIDDDVFHAVQATLSGRTVADTLAEATHRTRPRRAGRA